jgi:hypothetical protein
VKGACGPGLQSSHSLAYSPVIMFLPALARRTARATALLLVPVLLLAQGLQLCLHVHDDVVTTSDHVHASAVHLESAFNLAGGHDEAATDVDMTLATLLKAFYAALSFVIVSALVLHATPRLGRVGGPWPPDFLPHPHDIHRLTPPLRAPPR